MIINSGIDPILKKYPKTTNPIITGNNIEREFPRIIDIIIIIGIIISKYTNHEDSPSGLIICASVCETFCDVLTKISCEVIVCVVCGDGVEFMTDAV